MDTFDLIFNPYKKRKKIILTFIILVIIIILLTIIISFFYSKNQTNNLLRQVELALKEDTKIYNQIPNLILDEENIAHLYNSSTLYSSIKEFRRKYDYLKRNFSWFDVSQNLESIEMKLNKLKTISIETIYLAVISIRKREKEINEQMKLVSVNQNARLNEITRNLEKQKRIVSLLEQNIEDARIISNNKLSKRFFSIDTRLSLKFIEAKKNNEKDKEIEMISYYNRLKDIEAERTRPVASPRPTTQARERSSKPQDVLTGLVESAQKALFGESRLKADALSDEIEVRIFDVYSEPGNQFNFTVIVQNKSNKSARNVTVYVRIQGLMKEIKLQPVSVLPPGDSKRWDLRGTAPQFPRDYKMTATAVWNNGLYNKYSANLKVKR